jgi:hypothetical protein
MLHLLTQYLWPDDAPTGIYVEQVADAMAAKGVEVRLVAGSGSYRPGRRQPPRTAIRRLQHLQGRRGSLLSTAMEYLAVQRAFARYVEREVSAGDVVVVTSAPPTTLSLHALIHRRKARGVYWLQDFYPQLVRGILDPPAPVIRLLEQRWERSLASWDHVVKSAANLGYHGANSTVIRNWNTVEPGEPRPARPRTALYSGNLGYGHDLGAFLAMCSSLRLEGFEITVRGDGPGMRRLPPWIRAEELLADSAELVASYWAAELHLVAGDPRLPEAVFPSKLWNSRAFGRTIRASGFSGPLAAELEVALRVDFRQHLPGWVEFLSTLPGDAGGGAR